MSEEITLNPKQLYFGLNLDSVTAQLKPGQYPYALNAVVEGWDGNILTIQNEQGNLFCFDFPVGYKVIGAKNISQLGKIFFILTNPETGDSEVGLGTNDTCEYKTLISDVGNGCKFGFNINFPIHKMVVKTTNCSTQVYFTDGQPGHRMYIDLDDLPWVEEIDPNNSFKRIKKVGELDCNKLRVQPDFSIPEIKGTEVTIGGNLLTGVYQGVVQYANSLGEGLTGMYNATNPIGIFEQKESPDFNLPTAKAITFEITNLDQSGLYEYFNLIVIKTINNIVSVEQVGTFPTANPTYTYTYTGVNKTDKALNIEDVFQKYPYYDVAEDLFVVDNVLGWDILKETEEKNYQPFWSKVSLLWESYKIPYNQFQGYNNGINVEKFKGYMRDEVYPYEGCFIFKNGKQSRSYHIPGRQANMQDVQIVQPDNPDNGFSTIDPCNPPQLKFYWQVYNTGSVTATPYPTTPGDCYIGPYQYGEMAYWESEERYPNNTEIWGALANQRIRHHKMPDVLVSPIHDNNDLNDPSFEHSIFPLGVKINPISFIQALKDTLTAEEISQIAGFKITRGNRVNNKSIIAKGLIHNIGTTRYDDKNYFYPNYPFNDLREDPYFVNTKLDSHAGFITNDTLKGFDNLDSKSHFTFHSPDTHFYQPSLGNTGQFLKMETIEYGQSIGHFVKVTDNAEYKFLTPRAIQAAAGLGISGGVVIGAGMMGWPEYTMANVVPTYAAAVELFERLVPFTNFGYTFNSVGNYNRSFGIPNDGFKQRGINFNKYIIDGLNSVENGKVINNFRRESSVYIATGGDFQFPHEYSNSIPTDTSRYNIASLNGDFLSPETNRLADISSYYGSIKRDLPNQWGYMYSYETIDTGYYQSLRDSLGNFVSEYPTIFGGDVFINRFAYKSKLPFFRDNTVGNPNSTDIAYEDIGNLNYPMFWMSTKAQSYDVNLDEEIEDVRREFLAPSFFALIANLVGGGARGSQTAVKLIGKLFEEIGDKIGVKNLNLDRAVSSRLFEEGLFYLFAYGIPYFFCESEVNVDYRQATNTREGNFYPNVGGDIPDDWLQEVSVPIIQDNMYTYNKTYSKQNKENYFAHLREDYDPNKLCNSEFQNRAIWSEKSSLEETKNNWLVYKPISRIDFPKNYGLLVSVDGIENTQVLVRFENKTQLYNTLLTAPTSVADVYLGKSLFATTVPPWDYADTDLGYIGTQNKFLLKTEHGDITIDALRGQIFLINGQQSKELSAEGASKFFTEYLPFTIKKAFPDYPIDNHFNGAGLHGVYDPKYDRFIITKLDYKPLLSTITYDGEVFKDGDTVVELTDSKYFCNTSFTISYSFTTNSWTSYHSYLPNYYVGNNNFFYSGKQNGLWKHDTALTLYNNFYGEIAPYIIEYPYSYKYLDEILQNVQDYSKILQYDNWQSFVETDDFYFNKCIVYSNQQCSGILELDKKPKNNLFLQKDYPKYNTDSKTIMYTKSGSFYQFNTFWDLVKDPKKPIWTPSCESVSIFKDLNQSNMSYGKRSFNKTPIRSKDLRIRLINDKYDNLKFVSQFTVTGTMKSYK